MAGETPGRVTDSSAGASSLRVAILAHGLSGTGAVSVGRNLMTSLGRVAPNHVYLVTVPAGSDFEAICAALPKSEVFPYRRGGLVRRWWDETFRLPKIVAASRPDVLLALADRGLARPPCPQAILVHRPQLFYPAKHYANDTLRNKMLHAYHRRHLAKSLRRTALVLCQTAVAERRLRECYHYTGRTAVVPNAVSRFTLAGHAHHEMPERFLPYKEKMRLFCLTTYYAHKNLEVVIDLFRRYREVLRDVVVFLTIAPEQGKKAARLLREIERRGLSDHVVNLGPLPQAELAAYYAHCQAMFLPTLLESFTGTYLEAMHFGVPILTSDLDFARAVCGDAAVYFDPWDVASIQAAILRLKGNAALASELAAKGRERLEAMFRSWDDIARQVAGLLEGLASSGQA